MYKTYSKTFTISYTFSINVSVQHSVYKIFSQKQTYVRVLPDWVYKMTLRIGGCRYHLGPKHCW